MTCSFCPITQQAVKQHVIEDDQELAREVRMAKSSSHNNKEGQSPSLRAHQTQQSTSRRNPTLPFWQYVW